MANHRNSPPPHGVGVTGKLEILITFHHKGLKKPLTKFEAARVNPQGGVLKSTRPKMAKIPSNFLNSIQNGGLPVGFRVLLPLTFLFV